MKYHFTTLLLLCGLFVLISSSTPALAAQPRQVRMDTVIVDSEITLAQALAGSTAPAEILRELRIVSVQYYGFDGRLHEGQMVVHRELERDVAEIFEGIRRLRFPVESVLPILFDLPSNEAGDGAAGHSDTTTLLGPSDHTTMDTLNNSCGFHYRVISTFRTTKLSYHAYGRAVDINPFQNPAILRDGTIIPAGAAFDPGVRGTISLDSPVGKKVVQLFLERGWEWGGTWRSLKDYMHFEKH